MWLIAVSLYTNPYARYTLPLLSIKEYLIKLLFTSTMDYRHQLRNVYHFLATWNAHLFGIEFTNTSSCPGTTTISPLFNTTHTHIQYIATGSTCMYLKFAGTGKERCTTNLSKHEMFWKDWNVRKCYTRTHTHTHTHTPPLSLIHTLSIHYHTHIH